MSEHIYTPPQSPLEIIYQDDDLLVLNKQSGLLTVPGRSEEKLDSLAYRAQQQFPTATSVHRLDMDTSGLVVMALNPETHRHISRQFEQRKVNKLYHAWVWGNVKQECGDIDLPLICDWPNRPRQMVDHNSGKKALTHWKKLVSRDNQTLMELRPHTGRSHQLRVHMQAIGHPILADEFYAHPEAFAAAPQLQLHASFIEFEHPSNGSTVSFHAAAPFAMS
jgi:tRNA pseudouridine32 synthase/23S rRNA pseudouridine746 synthase